MTTQIATVVFIHLKTTGLPPQRPRIAKLSMVAVERGSISATTAPPRVVNELLLCFNPEKTSSDASESITGLTDTKLRGQSPFSKKTCQLILGFLDHLQPPVCLVAHNGNACDFPLLQAEFFRCQFNAPPEILCADFLGGFRKLDSDGVAVSRPLPAATAGGEQQTDEASAAHFADGDAHTLMMCAMADSKSFLKCLDESAVPLNTCRVMNEQQLDL